MHPILEEYYRRFVPTERSELKISGFFTALGENYEKELPYLYFIEKACERLIHAWKKKEKICIYSDYDTDAVTAAATMYWGLVSLGFSQDLISFYAPDRFTEGYGVNVEALGRLALKNDLIITVDCGINSVEEANLIQDLKEKSKADIDSNQKVADLIITDHHHLNGELPNCIAVINPRLKNLFKPGDKEFMQRQNYLSDSVTGVGVAWFMLVWLGYWMKYKNGELKEIEENRLDQLIEFSSQLNLINLNNLLPFVAIGTVADCQSIVEQTNRILVKSGLKIMQQVALKGAPATYHKGLFNIIKTTGLKDKVDEGYEINSSDIAFTLSPVLNSAGRMSHAMLSISALVGGSNDFECLNQVQELVAENSQRKLETKRILADCENEAALQVEQGNSLIWLASSDWSKGLIGLLASRLVAKYQLPVVVLELPEVLDPDAKVSASLRAPDGYNLPAAMQELSWHFLKFGGHPGAAGFSCNFSELSFIRTGMGNLLLKQSEKIGQLPKTNYLSALDSMKQNGLECLKQYMYKPHTLWIPEEVAQLAEFWESLDLLEPYGIDLPNPLIVMKVGIGSRVFMSENKHIKLSTHIFQSGSMVPVLKFNLEEEEVMEMNQVGSGDRVLVFGRASKNAWKNKLTWQVIAEKIIKIS